MSALATVTKAAMDVARERQGSGSDAGKKAGVRMSNRTHRIIRQLHLWIGAWGAIASILFGVSGFLLDHRGVMRLPQGDTVEVSRTEFGVPEGIRESPEGILKWLREEKKADVEGFRMGRGGEKKWTFSGGNSRVTTQVDYTQGANSMVLRTSEATTLAVLNRLHKGIGGGLAWTLLADSFAISMVALGISGLVMWARGRTLRKMALSVFGVALLVVLIVGGIAVS